MVLERVVLLNACLRSSAKQALCRRCCEAFVGGVSKVEETKVGVLSGFSTFQHESFHCFDGGFRCAVGSVVARSAGTMLELPCLGKGGEFLRCVLRT